MATHPSEHSLAEERAPVPSPLDFLALYRAYAERVEEQWQGHLISVQLRNGYAHLPPSSEVGQLLTADADTIRLWRSTGEVLIPTPIVLFIRHAAMFGEYFLGTSSSICPGCEADKRAQEAQPEDGSDDLPPVYRLQNRVDLAAAERIVAATRGGQR